MVRLSPCERNGLSGILKGNLEVVTLELAAIFRAVKAEQEPGEGILGINPAILTRHPGGTSSRHGRRTCKFIDQPIIHFPGKRQHGAVRPFPDDTPGSPFVDE